MRNTLGRWETAVRRLATAATALALALTISACGPRLITQPGVLLELRKDVRASDVATLTSVLRSDSRVYSVEYLSATQTADWVRRDEEEPSSTAALERIRTAPPALMVELQFEAPESNRDVILAMVKRPEFAALFAHPGDPEFGFGGGTDE
jgi:hypothetical protein